MLTYRVSARRIDSHGGVAMANQASVILDTDLAGRNHAMNPAQLLSAALSACIIKGIERVSPMIQFAFEEVELELEAERQDTPPKLVHIRYRLLVRTTESDQRPDLLHTNIRKYGTIYNTLAGGTELTGTIGRLV